MKNRKRESCTSGTVRDEDGNILIYSARNAETVHALWRPASEKRQGTKSRWVGHWRCCGLYGELVHLGRSAAVIWMLNPFAALLSASTAPAS